VDFFGHLFREKAEVDSVAGANGFDDKFLLPFVLDKMRAEFFSMGINTMH
jgi:hypothetical protein